MQRYGRIDVTEEAVINEFNCMKRIYIRFPVQFGLNKKISFWANCLCLGQIVIFRANCHFQCKFFPLPSKMPSRMPMIVKIYLWKPINKNWGNILLWTRGVLGVNLPLSLIIMELVDNRSFTLATVKNKWSRLRHLKNGDPERSDLEIFVFNIHTFDLPTTISRKYAYTDDLATGAELGGARGATVPQNFAWPPKNFPRDVMPLE